MHSVETAKKIREISKIFVSTDDLKIKQEAKKNNCIIIDRPKKLATAESPEWKSWKHAINFAIEKFGDNFNFISIPPTSPLRHPNDIKKCIKAINRNYDIVITLRKSNLDPYFNMVMKSKEKILTFKKFTNEYMLRKNSYNIYSITTVAFVSKPIFILNNKNYFQGKVKGIVIPEQRAVDIDTKFDFDTAKAIIKRNIK
jgi:N-acylneuraminate cytidylyltransferase